MPDSPENQEEIDSSPESTPVADRLGEGGDDSGNQNQGPGLNDAQNAYNLKDKLAGGGVEKGAEGAAGGAGEAATGTAGSTGTSFPSGAGAAGANFTAGGGAAGAGSAAGTAGAATGTGAAGAVGAAGGAGVAAGATSGTAGVTFGAGLSSTGVGAAAGVPIAVASTATTKKGRGWLVAGCLGFLGLIMMPVAVALLVLFIFIFPILGGIGTSTGRAAGNPENSTVLRVTKTASVSKIPRGANGIVTYTIIITNTSASAASDISVSDSFTSSPQARFAGEITGYEANFTVPSIPSGQSVRKDYTVTIPHTDFDPGWVLFNTVKSSGTVNGKVETSTAGATVIIGNPPEGPPAFSPLKGNVYRSGYYFGEVTEAGTIHPGTDISSSDFEIYSPFAQPALVTFTGGTCSLGPTAGYGQYMILQSGEWEVLMSHFACGSFTVQTGDTVNSATLLGVIGLTGYTTGPHVHYEVHQNGTKVNPESYNALVPHP